MLEKHIAELAKKAGLLNPEFVARQLLLLKEGAIVAAHLGHTENPAKDAMDAARELIRLHKNNDAK